MDGFTSIPIQNAGSVLPSNSTIGNANEQAGQQFVNTPYKDNPVGNNDGIEITDNSTQQSSKTSFGFLLPISILCLLAVFGYFGYLVFLRFVTLEKITLLSEQFQVLAQGINKSEIDDFLAMDNSLKAVKQKVATHTQLGGILAFVNKNIRTSVQISDYRIESRENEVAVSLASIAPTFRELAEQTEKMAELKASGAIKDFTVTQMALESDGRRVRYTLNLIFDKSKISALAQESNNPSGN